MAIINPTPIFQKNGVHEEFCVFSGYVKSVTDRGKYNSVSFKVNSDDCGIDAPLVSVRCFEQKIGVNHKKLVENAKGRYLHIVAVKDYYDGKFNYIARQVSLTPREYAESTHPVIDETPAADDIPERVAEPEAEYEQLSLFDNIDDESLPF